MSSMFDTLVRERREHTPWAKVNAFQFMKEMALNVPSNNSVWEHAAELKVIYRPSVASRFWWTLTWSSVDGERKSVDAQELDLCLWRAAEVETEAIAKLERERERKPWASP